jgi:hypothetical protein
LTLGTVFFFGVLIGVGSMPSAIVVVEE